MSSSRLYKRYLQLLNQWPLDPSKGRERDLGQHLRNRIASAFKDGENTQVADVAKCEAILASLERIANDTYFLPNDAKIATASGLDPESAAYLTSQEAIEEFFKPGGRKILPFLKISQKENQGKGDQ